MSAQVRDLSQGELPAEIVAEVCIVGSGSGGATAARVLAEAGRDVVVLEEGADFRGRLNQREAEMYDQLYMDRGGRATEDMSISVLQGRVLGGGGVINASDVVPIPDQVLEHWVKRFGLTDFSPKAMALHTKAALEDLGARPIAEEQVNAANRLLRFGAETLKIRGELMMHNRKGCAGLGTCLIGCPIGAKQNPRMVAIPKALAAGARIFTRARAVRIENATAETKRVVVRSLDPKGYHERGELVVRAPVVIVAANAVATPQLLLRSKIGNAHVGRHLMLQPQLPITAEFREPVHAFSGIPQAYAITEHETHDAERGLGGYRIEAVMGTPGMVASLLPFVGERGKQLMTRYAHVAGALLLVPDQPSGSVELLGSGRPRIRYAQREDHKSRLRDALRVAARAYLAAGASRVLVPLLPPLEISSERDLAQVDAISFGPATAPLLSAHQQGSVRMSPSKKDGAAAPNGNVYGARDVYVFDSSGFPSSASSHTMTPIISVSRALSARLIAERFGG